MPITNRHGISMLIASVLTIGAWTGLQGAEITTPTFMVGGKSRPEAASCTQELEGVASSTLNTNSPTSAVAAHGRGQHTQSLGTWENWDINTASNEGWAVPYNSSVLGSLGGDAWSTFSATNNLVYASFIGRRQPDGISCFALAASSPSELAQRPPVWRWPATCAVTLRSDVPRMVFDDPTRTLWLVAKNAGIRINVFKDCQSFPGDSGCRQTAQIGPFGPDTLKFGISVNPCTGNLILVYRDPGESASANIRMRFYSNEGTRTGKNFVLRSGHRWSTNAGCGNGVVRRCNQGTATCGASAANTCMRMNGMPSVAAIRDSATNRCYAAVAYDAFFGRWIKSRLDIVDVTDESTPSVVKARISTDTKFAWNQYLSYVTIDAATKNIGWFWISDNRGPCSVGIEGAVDSNLGLQNMTSIGKFDGTFPAIRFSGPGGINDYNQGGAGGGFLYPTWGASVCAPLTCGTSCVVPGASCSRWGLAAKIARIRPSPTQPPPRPDCSDKERCCEPHPAGGCFSCVEKGKSCN